ncbi:MAG TPA: aminomethyl-transferring glycine dehydrogenase subunit GcvPA, partial [Deinococcales bacterium]|nr:aminomethyl-transferring glycine dehydrogenase subunit GcvPA [Deinococcales bacterium]
MKYTPHTPEEVRAALQVIGANSVDDLFADVPANLRDPDLDLPPGLDETQLLAHMKGLAGKNRTDLPSFLGGGSRRHFVPSAVNALTFQSAFVTAYTPYQPEVSQGLLQGMFEYQSMMCELTGLDVSNSSLYDGATALAEAALLAMRATGRERIVVSRGVHPDARSTTNTFLNAIQAPVDVVALRDGRTAWPEIPADTAAVVVQNPNHLGFLEDVKAAAEAAHAAGALLIAVVDPFSLALLATPGETGVDIAVGDGQPLGNDPAFGGPTFGFMVVREALLRQVPGRLVGQTTDGQGRRGFVLTLQAREQHIRRAKAKSNICSNHALMALQAAIHLSALGPNG